MAGIAVIWLALCMPLGAQGENIKKIEDSRQLIEDWVKTQQIISKEENAWRESKELIEYRIDLFKSEIEDLDKAITDAEEAASDAERKREELQLQSNSFKAAADVVDSVAGDYEIRLRELTKQFPKPLLVKIEPLLSKMPKNPRQTSLTAGERMAVVIGIVNEVHKFNGAITLVSELIEVRPGETAEVKTLYFGLGQAFFVDAKGEHAGVKFPSPEGWKKEDRNELASSISDSIAIYEGIKPSDKFIELPIDIK